MSMSLSDSWKKTFQFWCFQQSVCSVPRHKAVPNFAPINVRPNFAKLFTRVWQVILCSRHNLHSGNSCCSRTINFQSLSSHVQLQQQLHSRTFGPKRHPQVFRRTDGVENPPSSRILGKTLPVKKTIRFHLWLLFLFKIFSFSLTPRTVEIPLRREVRVVLLGKYENLARRGPLFPFVLQRMWTGGNNYSKLLEDFQGTKCCK